MARSHFIYYFRSKPTGRVWTAFTVKHEALAFADRNELKPCYWELWRVRDGGSGSPELTKEFNLKAPSTDLDKAPI